MFFSNLFYLLDLIFCNLEDLYLDFIVILCIGIVYWISSILWFPNFLRCNTWVQHLQHVYIVFVLNYFVVMTLVLIWLTPGNWLLGDSSNRGYSFTGWNQVQKQSYKTRPSNLNNHPTYLLSSNHNQFIKVMQTRRTRMWSNSGNALLFTCPCRYI